MRVEIIGPAPLVQGLDPIGDRLNHLLKTASPATTKVLIMVAYVNESFLGCIGQEMENFVKSGGNLQAIVGIDSRGTSRNALESLLSLLGSNRLHIYHNPADGTFHPKMFVVGDGQKAIVFVGSSNLTGGGLAGNFEINVSVELNISEKADRNLLASFEAIFAKAVSCPSCLNLNHKILDQIDKAGALKKRLSKDERSIRKSANLALSTLFGKTSQKRLRTLRNVGMLQTAPCFGGKSFIMSLVNNDVSGKRWDPYFLIPIGARDLNPKFWGWPKKFAGKTKRRPERRFLNNVKIRNRIYPENGRLAYYSGVDEFRFKSDMVYNLGVGFSGSFILISWLKDKKGADVANIEIVPKRSALYRRIRTRKLQKVGSLDKVYGYI